MCLTWDDVNWEQGLITVHSPKTEYHPHGEMRVIPLFPELRKYLERAFHEAEPGTKYVITRYSCCNPCLGEPLKRIINRAGVKLWPKRASRQTELTSTHPLHVVCNLLGNSALIADKHYLQVIDQHYEEATERSAIYSALPAPKAAHNTAQQAAASSCTDLQETKTTGQNKPVVLVDALQCNPAQENFVPHGGGRSLLVASLLSVEIKFPILYP